MTEIYQFIFFVLFSVNVAGQLMWIAHMLRELVETD
jgi:hypothetical protein